MESKFTRGEWIENPKAKGNVMSKSGRSIANCNGYRSNKDDIDIENFANARLICAAPDMFNALTAFVENVDRWIKTGEPADEETSKKIYEDAKNSLNKALGKWKKK